ncbi:MAG: CHAT domain-containing protein [Blastocatellia bacterium]
MPFATLVDERNQYLVERYSFSYLTSGRDLLRLQARLPRKPEPAIVADPVFGERAGVTLAQRRDVELHPVRRVGEPGGQTVNQLKSVYKSAA